MSVIPKPMTDILEGVVKQKISNFKILLHRGSTEEDGSLSDTISVSLKNKKTNEDHHLLIKQSLTGVYPKVFRTARFQNEANFYLKVWPAMNEFQNKHLKGEPPLNLIGKCFYTDLTDGSEKIVLENLDLKNYTLYPKNVSLSDEHYEHIFKLYGKLHGLSFAWRKMNRKIFKNVSCSLQNNWEKFFTIYPSTVSMVYTKIIEFFDPEADKDILKKLQKYDESGVAIILDKLNYKGTYSVVLHGDCWSNNMLFKYNESKVIEEIKLTDFEMSFIGSPVYDLSYILFAGSGKETLDKLEEFLKIYHKSLSETLILYKCKPENIYPYNVLKSEWKKYSTFGFIVGLLALGVKDNAEEKMKDLVIHMHEAELL